MTGGRFSAEIFGWQITQPPPPITGTDQFGPNPGPSFALEQSTFAAIPQQSIAAQTPTSTNLALVSQPAAIGELWSFLDEQPLICNLTTPYNCDVTLTVNIAGVVSGGNAQCDVSVNNQRVGSLPCGSTLSQQTLTIPYNFLTPINLSGSGADNVNTIQLGGGGTQASFLVSSISVQSTSVPIYARGRWVQVAAGDLPPAGSGQPASATYTIDINSGTSSTRSQSDEFATDLNISGSLDPSHGLEALLKIISFSLSVGYSEQQSQTNEHSITIDSSTSTTWSYTLYADPNGTLTYQIWQLEFMYEAGASGHVMAQLLGPAISPIIINTYTPTAKNALRPLALSRV